MKDVAREAGVSVATVSRVINKVGYVSPELIRRVRAAMAKLDYHPNKIARSLRTQETKTISVIVSDISNPFFSMIVRGAEDAAAKRGFTVLVCNTDEDPQKESQYINILRQTRPDGLIIAPTSLGAENLKVFQALDKPIVFVDRVIEGVKADAVLCANASGAYQATEFLIRQGHRRIGIILGIKNALPSEERFAGYKSALADYGILLDESLVTRGNFRMAEGQQACEQLLDLPKPPSAIFVLNNLMTIGALRAIRERGLRCPEDISIVGYDDFEWMALFDPPVTTVAQQPYRMGYQAAEVLIRRIKAKNRGYKEKVYRIEPQLIVRGSVATLTCKERGGEISSRISY